MTRRGLFVAPFDSLCDPRVIGDLAATAEGAGWDGLFVWDHMQYGDRVDAVADPWVCCAAIALRTEQMIFGPMVTPLARRRPQVVARESASLAVMSEGRFVLGVGLGDDWVGEFSAFGDEAEPKVRARMLDESLPLIRSLLSGEPVDHKGEFYRASGARFRPAPPVPVWVGGRFGNAAPLRRAAGHDGYFLINVPGPDDLAGVRSQLAGHDVPASYDVVVELEPGADPQPWVDAGATWLLTRVGPYDIDRDAAFALAAAGPS